MRHLKIAAKIGIGFGIECVLMVIIAIAVFLSGTGTTNSVDNVETMVMFDAAVNDAKSVYYDARLYANVFFNDDSDAAYNDLNNASTKANQTFKDLTALASSNYLYDDAIPSINAFNTAFNSWQSNLAAIRSNYIAINEIKARLNTSIDNAIAAYDVIFNDGSTPTLALNFVARTAVSTQSVFTEAEKIIAGRDIESYEQVVSDLNYIVILLSGNQYSDITNELKAYKDALTEYVDLLNVNSAKETEARSLGSQALTELDSILVMADTFMHNTIDSTKGASQSATTIVLIITGIAVGVSAFLAIFLANKISAPLKRVRDRLQRMADTGDIHMGGELEAVRYDAIFRDEVGQCNKALVGLLDTLDTFDKNLNEIANGNLSVDVRLLSQEDSMGKSMRTVLQSLNKTFGEVNGISREIADNARDVSESSMSLAQGATEQTAAVAALGQSISKVAEKTLESANMAIDAAKLGDTIKHNAEIGTQQMEQMLDAVGQITDASASISKVIKVIDDIAFQTNILALNAAVEAARAGQHGKGFAVVAEEVRNLAAKSAEAAKDTGSLIENSIQKAELGAKIATATSSSLAEIVAGINESSKIVNIIAESSENQTNAINEINRGISQVGEVVHLISKGAELSSGASNSMREESDALHRFVSSYQLTEKSGLFLGQ